MRVAFLTTIVPDKETGRDGGADASGAAKAIIYDGSLTCGCWTRQLDQVKDMCKRLGVPSLQP